MVTRKKEGVIQMFKLNKHTAVVGAALLVGLLALGTFATPAPPPPQQPPPRPLPELILQTVNQLQPLAHVFRADNSGDGYRQLSTEVLQALPDLDSNALSPFVMASTPVPLVVSLPKATPKLDLLMFNPKEYLKSGSWDGGVVFLGEQAGRAAVGAMKWSGPELSPQIPAGLYGVAAIFDPQGKLAFPQESVSLNVTLYLILIALPQASVGQAGAMSAHGGMAAIIGLDRAWVSEYQAVYQAVLAQVGPDDEKSSFQWGVGGWLNMMAIKIEHEGI
jgi:hypothetical protein